MVPLGLLVDLQIPQKDNSLENIPVMLIFNKIKLNKCNILHCNTISALNC